jgi:putative nucleotidyltransferase with HDIG domain
VPDAEAMTPAQELVGRIADVSSLPTVALKIAEVVRDVKAGARELLRVVETDVSLTARVLRTVNSAAYGLSGRVSNLQQAISFLGFSQIRNLALTASVSRLFQQSKPIGSYNRLKLWHHLVSVAVAARLIARRLELREFEDAFLAGLLHDIGLILEDQHVHEGFRMVVEAAQPGRTLREIEQKMLGFDHTQIGALIAEQWHFPELICRAIAHHHASHEDSGDGHVVVQCVDAANILVSVKGTPSIGVNLTESRSAVFGQLGFSPLGIRVLSEDLDVAVKRHQELFELL